MDQFALIALLIGVMLATLSWWRRSRSAAIAAGAWAVYAAYEHAIVLRILCSGECNIRIDLFIIWPLLAIVTLIALWRLAHRAWTGAA